MRNIYKVLGIISILIVLGILWFIKYKNVNDKYPESELIVGEMGAPYEYMGRLITVKNIEFVDGELYKDFFKGAKSNYKIALVTVNINELNDCRQYNGKFDLTNWVLESDAWYNGLEIDLYRYINEDTLQNMSADICNNIDLVLPFWLLDSRFTKKSWNHLNDRNYCLVFDRYPQKHTIQCNIR